jgi:4-diphosphocytidyl-2-C-methyl-D-erythritol kinase
VGSLLTVKAPAKINLTLEVLGKRPDGYHEIRSIIQTISLCDTLHFSSAENVEIRCALPGWSSRESLVSKAVSLIKNTFTYEGGVTIEVNKRIPLMAGLGGDSSDAAAVLLGLNELWGLDLSLERLHYLALQLGSDMTFFLTGGTALMEGRGEKITSLPSFPHQYVILVNPSVPRQPGKTAAAYSSLQPAHFTDGKITSKLTRDLETDQDFNEDRLFNVFENVFLIRNSELTTYREHIKKIGATHVHLAGSGPAMFTLIEDKKGAEDLTTRLKNQGMEIYLVKTFNKGVTLVTG